MGKNLNEVLVGMLNEAGITENAAGIYLGRKKEYAVFRTNTRPSEFADDIGEDEEIGVEIHYIAPYEKNVIEKRRSIRRGIRQTFGASAEETEATDEHAQYFVYEFTVQEGEAWED